MYIIYNCIILIFHNRSIVSLSHTHTHTHIYIYSQVHKYWDIDTILTFLALYPPQWISNETNKMCFNCRLSALIWGYLHPNQVNGVGITTVCICALPLVKGPKVMGQLASQLFHGQVCVIPSLSQLQWADKRSRVHFKCAIYIWNLLLSTVKMRSKELSLSVKQAIIRLKKTKTNPSER